MALPISDSIIVAIAKLVDDSQVESREPTHSEIEFQINKAGLKTADPKYQGQTVGENRGQKIGDRKSGTARKRRDKPA